MDRLRELLRNFTSITAMERRFDTGDGIEGLGDNPFVGHVILFLNQAIIFFFYNRYPILGSMY